MAKFINSLTERGLVLIMKTSGLEGERVRVGEVESLVYEYQARLRAFLFSRTGDPDVADDLAQEVFLVVMKRMDDFDASRPAWPWLVGIARNKLLEYWRSRPRETPTDSIESFIEQEHVIREKGHDPAQVHEQRLNALRACMDKLAPDSQKLLRMTHKQELKGKDIATLLHKKATAIRVALHRIRSWLAVCIRRRLEELSA